MSKSASARRKKDTKSKTTSENLLLHKDASVSDITKYIVKQPDLGEIDGSDTNVSIPCPDDAALPCSAFLNSNSSQSVKGCLLCENNCKSRESPSVRFACSEMKSLSAESANVNSIASKKKNKKLTLVARNSQITDFFPVRRSNRKTLISKMTERNKIIEDAILSGREEGFEIKEFPDKGRGVITTKAIKRGDFVLEYYGELIDYEEAKRRESIYSDKENIGCYMYYFRFQNKQYCIDATKETDRLGRLVNHSKKGNLKTRTFLIEESPHLILFAGRDIQPGEELCYDYGDRRKAALESHPWLAS